MTRLQPPRQLAAGLFLTLACAVVCPSHAQPTYELDATGNFVELEEPDPDTAEGQLQLIRRMLVAGEASDAHSEVEDWIEEHEGHPQMVEAYLIKADAQTARRNYYRALADYEYIVTLYPGTEQFRTALEREYDIAKLFTGGMYRRSYWLGLRIFPAEDIGIELLIRVQERMPGSALGERASMSIGDYYFDKGEMDMASEAYDLFLLNYPESSQREWAMLRQIQASLARYKGPEFDPSGLTDAAQRLREYADEFPAAAEKIGAEALMVRINESLAEKKLATARWYDKRGKERGAITLYRLVIQDFPQSAAAVEALKELEERGVPLVDPRGPQSRKRGGVTEEAPETPGEPGDEE